MLARSRLSNWVVKRERTNSQVLTVFFFRVGPVILQMEIDSLCYFHGAPPVVRVVGAICSHWIIHHDTEKLTKGADRAQEQSRIQNAPLPAISSEIISNLQKSKIAPFREWYWGIHKAKTLRKLNRWGLFTPLNLTWQRYICHNIDWSKINRQNWLLPAALPLIAH